MRLHRARFQVRLVVGAAILAICTADARAISETDAHFAAANTTHDGRLTRQQAFMADWPRVVRAFDEIDTDHRGWISLAQIHRFNREKSRAARHKSG